MKCVCFVASSFMDCHATHFGPLVRQGDLELLVQELKALQGGERWTCLGRRNRRNPQDTCFLCCLICLMFFFCCVDRRLELCECSWNLDFRLKFKVVERCQHVPCLVRLYTSTWSWPKTHGGIGIFELKQKSLAL